VVDMQHSFLNLLSPMISFIFYICIQVCGVRWIKNLSLFNSMVIGSGIGLVVLTSLEFYWFWSSFGFYSNLATNLAIYLCLSYNYFHFINMGETARRIRIIREIYDSPNGLSEGDILTRYNSEQMIELRIERLLSKKQVTLKNNYYFIDNSTMLVITKAMIFLKVLLLGKKSEFD
jgi:hypothetical protein